ncbi:MAG: adenylate/guanylate cyclase domain-containing protein [Proteobacteria bacterium]|nr:adenylate/guanylate cyclase domain-containing protein [Pseudomonadota bacterium]MBU1716361.1 adenylate/guanylate cyclase domain-containing protein [Pseudomonadota bacterium]
MLKTIRKKTSASTLAAGIILTIILALAYVYQPRFCRFLDNKIYDIILAQVHNTQTSGVPVIIDLDDKSLHEYGQWPWPRYRVALLLAKIRQAGAVAIGLDILFAEPDRSSPASIQKELKRDLQVEIEFTGLPNALLDNDQLLAANLKDGPYVMGYFFDFDQSAPANPNPPLLHPLNLAVINSPGAESPHEYLQKAHNVVAPLPNLVEAAAGSGFFNTDPDEDGIIRSTPLIISWQNRFYPSLSLATLCIAMGKVPIVLKNSTGGIESLRLNKTIIPLDRNGRMILHFRGKSGCFPYFSASDILSDKLPAGSLAGKIALIGTTAAGLKDLRASPLDHQLPGVESHATIIDNIICGDFFSRPDWAPGLELSLIIFCGLITSIMIMLTDARWTLPVTALAGIFIWQGGLWFMKDSRIFVSPLFPILTLATNFSLLTVIKFWQTEKEKLFFREAFSRYVSKAVVDQVTESPEKLSLTGEEKELSIMFSDIRSFTSLSEQLTPTEVINLLQEYFTPMTRVITENYGTLDKFIGDAIMAFWNAPIDVAEHKKCAVKSGILMLKELGKLNKIFLEKYGFEINIGIGMHAGMVRVGNMGTKELFDYTIIGDNVNITSRLEGLCKFYGTRIVISETLKDHIPEGFVLQDLDLVRVKGRDTPLRVYGLCSGMSEERKKIELQTYENALENYRNRQFTKALELFSLLKNDYMDRKLYQLYIDRCQVFLAEPPPPEWDGVFSHTSK